MTEFTIAGCSRNPRIIAGGFTKGDEKGLNVFEFNPGSGELKLLSQSDAGPNPSYFCISSRNNLIYAANEVMEFKGKPGGGLTTLKYDPQTDVLEKAGEMVIPYGGPCFISLSQRDFCFCKLSKGFVAVVKLIMNSGI